MRKTEKEGGTSEAASDIRLCDNFTEEACSETAVENCVRNESGLVVQTKMDRT